MIYKGTLSNKKQNQGCGDEYAGKEVVDIELLKVNHVYPNRCCDAGGVICLSSEPCESCGDTPTKGYKNDYSGEKEYYCSDCSSDCAFCSNKAKHHYTSGLEIIIFACDDCYKEIQELNS